ncbi:hypothetical protein AnaeK_3938 [Anaeromyxobacter sp. K]|uniref:hypothetical protein n=1 Tax=Anaeromyxobacter sp. (strain K) TaxID=447217 RepID=UPI00015F89AE|nr:hypothetical protein [Anaeromyxobacter sp. K]ACG75145.1 hypothetical protein AnaeK_3938 [Anaeromyxobacter sp. K]
MGRTGRSPETGNERIVHVTRHAAERLRERVPLTMSTRRAARVLEDAVLRAIAGDELIDAGNEAWFAPVRLAGAAPAFAVVAIVGPKEKPYLVHVRTLLTSSMAARTHGHLVAVGCETSCEHVTS